MPSGRDVYFDVPASNLAVKAFDGGAGGFVAPKLFPAVPVDKQSGNYYTIDKNTWLLVPNDLRAPKTRPRRIEFKVSSDGYYAANRALAEELDKESLANADRAVNLRQNAQNHVIDTLLRALEVRVANKVTSISNVGSGVVLAGADKWGDANSDPVAQVGSGHAFIEGQTGLHANTLVIDKDTYRIARQHPLILDRFKYAGLAGGLVSDEQLKAVFEVDNLWVARGIKNAAVEGATASLVNIWGNNALLAYVDPSPSGLEVATFGIGIRWTPEGIPAPFQVERYDDPDPGKKVEVVQVGYYQDEKIVAAALAYALTSTL